jgi:glyoxylase I family protein
MPEATDILSFWARGCDDRLSYWVVMPNPRVMGLDTPKARLDAVGNVVPRNPDYDSAVTGRFARLHDPEGNPVEHWEPDT